MINLNELKLSLFLVWSILSIIILFILIGPLLLPQDSILELAPGCVSRIKYNKECSLCGMSRAFIAISKGNLEIVYSANKAAVPIYLSFVFNEVFFLGVIFAMCIKRSESAKKSRPIVPEKPTYKWEGGIKCRH